MKKFMVLVSLVSMLIGSVTSLAQALPEGYRNFDENIGNTAIYSRSVTLNKGGTQKTKDESYLFNFNEEDLDKSSIITKKHGKLAVSTFFVVIGLMCVSSQNSNPELISGVVTTMVGGVGLMFTVYGF